jgi:hypothetical protein
VVVKLTWEREADKGCHTAHFAGGGRFRARVWCAKPGRWHWEVRSGRSVKQIAGGHDERSCANAKLIVQAFADAKRAQHETWLNKIG